MNDKIIQIGDKAYKKCKVVMLATDKNSNIWISKSNGKLNYSIDKVSDTNIINQEIYILSNEEIKIGDWIYHSTLAEDSKIVFQCKSINEVGVISNDGIMYMKLFCKKIIATTNSELHNNVVISFRKEIFDKDKYQSLPRPSDDFIKKYCELNGKIDEVLVQYEEFQFEHYSLDHNGEDDYDENMEIRIDYKLKVAPDNTITIKPVKEKLYTKEELIVFCEHAFMRQDIGHPLPHSYIATVDSAKKWIDKNLN